MYYKIDKDKTFIRLDRPNDLWYLWTILKKDDIVEAHTYRSVEGMDERKAVKLKIQIEKIRYMKDIGSVRLTGKILEGWPEEYIQIGRYHSLDIREGSEIYVYKNWTEYEKELLEEAYKNSREHIADVILIDERHVIISKLFPIGLEIILDKDIPYSKYENNDRAKIYAEILNNLTSNNIIIAGPGFEKYNLKDYLKDKNIISIINTSYAETSSLKEIIPELGKIVQNYKIAKDKELIETLDIYLAKHPEMIVIGDEIVNYLNGALEYLILIDYVIDDEEVRRWLKIANDNGTKIHIISSNSPYAERVMILKLIGIRRY